MLTLEENRWNFEAIKVYSALNLLPLQIDMQTGKIQWQSSKMRVFLWKLILSLAITHDLFMVSRLIQSTMIEPEKYFRWDHFILHVPFALGYSLMSYTGFRLFGKTPQECVMIYSQLFVGRENPVHKMVNEEQTFLKQVQRESRKNGAKPEVWIKLDAKSVLADQKQNVDSDLDGWKNPELDSSSGVRPVFTWPPQYSLDEILVKTFPLWVFITQFFMMVVVAIDQSRPQHLYSCLPLEYQNVFSLVGLLVVEGVSMAVACLFALFSISSQLLFFSKCQAEFKQLRRQLRNLYLKFQCRPNGSRDIRREIWILRHILKEIRELVLFMELFNRCFPFCIFAFKLICFFPILLYFFTIRHFDEFPFLAVFTGYIGIVLTVIYGILYQKAFSIPEKMKELKMEFLVSAHKSVSMSVSKPTPENSKLLENFRDEMNREVEGIRNVGVQVGNFHTLERDATPKFMDFVFRNVVNLLVSFPR